MATTLATDFPAAEFVRDTHTHLHTHIYIYLHACGGSAKGAPGLAGTQGAWGTPSAPASPALTGEENIRAWKIIQVTEHFYRK